ncbi:MAG: hypothetical protein WCX79_00020 [Candidatus Paceibacterota bacterium]|jgi:hypothetical protein
MSEQEAYGMPKRKLIDGHYYYYNNPANNKQDAKNWVKNLKYKGLMARVVHQTFHGYDKYHVYWRGSE